MSVGKGREVKRGQLKYHPAWQVELMIIRIVIINLDRHTSGIRWGSVRLVLEWDLFHHSSEMRRGDEVLRFCGSGGDGRGPHQATRSPAARRICRQVG